jgi:hypothetical protein
MHIEMSSHTQEQRLPYPLLTLPTHRQTRIKRTWSAPESKLPASSSDWTRQEGQVQQHTVLQIQDVLGNPTLLSLLAEREQREFWQASLLLSQDAVFQQGTPLPRLIEVSDKVAAEAHHLFPPRLQPLIAPTPILQASSMFQEQRPARSKLRLPLYLPLILLGAAAVLFLYLCVPAFTTLFPFFSTPWGGIVMALELLGLAELLVCRILVKTTKR